MRTLGEYTDEVFVMDRKRLWRPTVKVQIGRKGEFLSFLSGISPQRKVNFAGGGINDGESAASALQRELEQECGLSCRLQDLSKLPVLVDCLTPSSRQNWRKKHLIIAFLEVESFDVVKPDNKELIAPKVHKTIADFQLRIAMSPGTRPEAATAYLEAAYKWLAMQL